MKWLVLLLALAASALGEKPRIVSAGGAITETIYALGAADAIVGVDSSSTYPKAAATLPQVGYVRALAAEGIVSLKPTLLLTSDEAGPPATLEQLKAAGVKIVQLACDETPAGVAQRTLQIAEVLGIPAERAVAVNEQMHASLAAARANVAKMGPKPGVLFIYARGGGVMNVAGNETSAAAIIKLAGGINAVTGYTGYKPLTAEAAVTAAPEVILMTNGGLESSGGIEGLLKQPGLALTPAGRERRILAMDDLLLLGFGPRLGEAVLELSRELHPAARTAIR